ncbi:MAG: hypothetical protein NC114_10720 [Ruminococcus flavefaciens]|nr:hypothetical protein [Ruminococcus flavefaciens]
MMAEQIVPWLQDLIGTLGESVVAAVNQEYAAQLRHDADVAKTATEQSRINTVASQLYNTKAQVFREVQAKAPKMLTGLGTAGMATSYDFDKRAKESDIRYGRSYSEFSDLITRFNVAKLPDYDGAPAPFMGHIIISRPSLYVNINGYGSAYSAGAVDAMPNPGSNFTAMKQHPKTSAFVNDKYGQMLLNMLSEYSSSKFMPVFTTRAVSYSVGDVALKTVEKGGTFYGHVIKYGHYSEEHKLGGSISIEFRNDVYWSILKTIYIWMMYIDIVSRSDVIRPSWISQMSGQLDYAGSIYYLVTDMGGSKLLYWEKLTGVFPKSAPFSLFSMSDGPGLEDKITIEFDYGMRSDPMDPNVLFDLNMLSGGSYYNAARYMQYGPGSPKAYGFPNYADPSQSSYWKNAVRPDGFARGGATFGLGDQFALKPIIQAVKGNNGKTLNYYLHWLKS